MFVRKSLRFLFIFSLLLSPLFLAAQQTQVYVADDVRYRDALDLFEKQKYAEAEDAFDKIVASSKNKNDLFVIDAQYYAAVSSLELYHKDAEIRLRQFLSDHPESPKCRK